MTDKFTIRAVVIMLGLFANLGLVGLLWLIYTAKNGLDASLLGLISGLTGTALGGLATLLVSTRSEPSTPTPVEGT